METLRFQVGTIAFQTRTILLESFAFLECRGLYALEVGTIALKTEMMLFQTGTIALQVEKLLFQTGTIASEVGKLLFQTGTIALKTRPLQC